jgi:hypothetical protein
MHQPRKTKSAEKPHRFFPEGLIKARYSDINRAGLCGSRRHLKAKIERGELPPPIKDGDTPQADAWWWVRVLEDHLADEYARTTSEHDEAA